MPLCCTALFRRPPRAVRPASKLQGRAMATDVLASDSLTSETSCASIYGSRSPTSRKLHSLLGVTPRDDGNVSPLPGEVIQNRDATGRIAKWALELMGQAITYVPQTAVKSQALADFAWQNGPKSRCHPPKSTESTGRCTSMVPR